MLQESQNSSDSLTLSHDPTRDNLLDESSYPYLTLLGRLCSSVKDNFETNEDYLTRSEKKDSFAHPKRLFDCKLYPYSSLLQSLISEANSKNMENSTEENFESCDRLINIMDNLSYPLEIASSSSKDHKQVADSSDYDMTYATKLKHIACQSAVEKVTRHKSNHLNVYMHESTVPDTTCFLTNIYPIELEECNNTVYSEKLKKICFEVKNKNNFKSWDTSSDVYGLNTPKTYINFENEPLQLTNFDCQLQFQCSKNENNSCNIEISRNQKHLMQNNAISEFKKKDNDVFLCSQKSGQIEDKYLFEAIMKNVEAYSMISHTYENNVVKDNIDTYQSKRERSKSSSRDLQGAGIKMIKKKIANQLKYVPRTS